MIANRAWQRWQLLALHEEIQLKSSQEEQQPRNRCCLLPTAQLGYTQPSSNKPPWRIWHTNLQSGMCTKTVRATNLLSVREQDKTATVQKHQCISYNTMWTRDDLECWHIELFHYFDYSWKNFHMFYIFKNPPNHYVMNGKYSTDRLFPC